jgi:hypothetical protein
MWYGNPAATDAADPEATFHFFDGFDGNDLGAAWAATGDYVVSGGQLSITSGVVYTPATLTEAPGWVFEARVRWPNGDSSDPQSGIALSNLLVAGAGLTELRLYRTATTFFGELGDGGVTPFAQGMMAPQHPVSDFGWLRLGTGPTQARWGWTHDPPGSLYDIDHPYPLTEDWYVFLGDTGGVGMGVGGDIYDVDLDAVLVRRFELARPVGFAGVEEDV